MVVVQIDLENKMALELPVNLDSILKAQAVVKNSEYVTRTPLVRIDPQRFGLRGNMEVYLKLESMQNQGSFKIRGVVSQIENASSGILRDGKHLVTMSAGNYGRSFAYMCSEMKLKGRVLMPATAPKNRAERIRGYGVEVEMMPTPELKPTVDRYVEKEGMVFLHPFDDPSAIAGHATMGLEILEDLNGVDIVLVPCGGGGLLAGTAAAIKLSDKGRDTRVIGVEPEQACTMFLSLKEGRPVRKDDVKSIASGLAPPFAGTNTYAVISNLAERVVLVSDEEIIESVKILYENGLVVEASGAATFVALKFGKVADTDGKKIVVTISGSNVSAQELCELLKQ